MSNERFSFQSPLGGMEVTLIDGLLFSCYFIPEEQKFIEQAPASTLAVSIKTALLAYCEGQQPVFDFPLLLEGTEFQQAVWKTLQTIPYGRTVSYQWVAEQINRPKAIRAVGTAIGKNPLGIIIPCHRVIGKNGQLRGFAAGLDTKANLLAIEQGVD
ncbi:MAG: methylated-DNA--[protein]-cysteine S-methyltransferase [Cellvibrionales bacterium]|nr:methylated-DNA--[protein]-cysteine S-methyltransferase [Cellvibrionales bacterium]